jgi:ubiquinone/menaquinone biosynthesis C-methylase UbiE
MPMSQRRVVSASLPIGPGADGFGIRRARQRQDGGMRLLDWDHNAYYHRLLMRQLPGPCTRVLDVGCGAGAFAAELARRVEHVDALDRSPEMIEAARQMTPANVTCILGDVMRDPLPPAPPHASVSAPALQHLPNAAALRRLTRALRPGGVHAAVALPRPDLARELPAEILAATGHRVLGATFAVLRASGRGGWYRLEPSHETMPKVLDSPLTTRQVRQHAAATLPGAQVRRLIFWRYLLLWQRPIETDIADTRRRTA